MITARHEYMDRPKFASDLSFEGDRGVTKQSDAKDCDINTIFKRYERTGQLPDMIVREPRYGDFSEVPDYQTSLEIVRTAQEQFDALGVDVRNRFANDPALFLAFVTDPKNVDEVERMGLLKPEIVDARRKARADKDAADIAAKIKAAQSPT